MKKLLSLISILAIVCGLLCGCSNGDLDTDSSDPIGASGKAAVCYVIANTACSQGLNLNSMLVEDVIYSTIRNYGYVSIINCDGNSELIYANSFDIDGRYKNASKDKLDMTAKSEATNLVAAMNTVVADDPEVDYLSALNLAVRSLSSLEGYDSKSVIVLGTGLSTTGILNFQNNILSADSNTVVSLLMDKQEIPDFSGITVYWQQMGDVAEPQETLTSAQRNKLQDIWAGIIEAGGGEFVFNNYISSSVNTEITYPEVTTVDLPADSPIVFDSSTSTDLSEPIVLTESQLMFEGDSSVFLYPEESKALVAPIAEFLSSNSKTLILCGCTAGDTNSDFSLRLSQERAQAVMMLLTELGVDEDRLICLGLGCDNPWHISGVGYDGAAAQSNRCVVLVDSSSETGKSLLVSAGA